MDGITLLIYVLIVVTLLTFGLGFLLGLRVGESKRKLPLFNRNSKRADYPIE